MSSIHAMHESIYPLMLSTKQTEETLTCVTIFNAYIKKYSVKTSRYNTKTIHYNKENFSMHLKRLYYFVENVVESPTLEALKFNRERFGGTESLTLTESSDRYGQKRTS